MPRLRRFALPRLLALVAAAALLAPMAWARSWRIADFKDTISISQDGNTLVVERIDLVFIGEWHGIHRIIPVEYPGPGRTNYTLFLDVNSVTDESGHKLKYESKTSRGYRDLKIYLPGAVDTTKSVEIEYTLRNAVRYFETHDEFYWNVTGNDWPVPIDHAQAFVTLPTASAGSLRAQAYTGVYGSTEGEASAQVNGADVTFETTNPLPMRGGLTIDIYIPKGILKEPGSFTKLMWFLGSNPVVFLPFVTLAVMFTLWWYKGRDPEPGMSVAPMYEPPAGMTPAEVGTIVDDSVDPRDITSTIVDLAVRGFIKIEETKEQGLIFKSKDYLLHLLKPREQWTSVAPHERVMLENIFGGSDATLLSSLKNRFYTALPTIRTNVMSALKSKGMYLVDPDSANAYNIGGIILALLPFGLLQFFGFKDFFCVRTATRWRIDRLGDHLVPVRSRDERKDVARRPHYDSRSRISGIHEPCGCRPFEAHAARHV